MTDPCDENCGVCMGNKVQIRFIRAGESVPKLSKKAAKLDAKFVTKARVALNDCIYHRCQACGHEWVGLTWHAQQSIKNA